MTIYYSKNGSMVSFTERAEVKSTEDLKDVVSKYNHVMAEFSDSDEYKGHRRRENFISSNIVYGDIDNTHTENSEEWMTISKFKTLFHQYEFYIVTSKSHQIEKGGKTARDKFHIYFPVKDLSSDNLSMWLKKLTTKYNFFDPQVKDVSRYFASSPNCKVYYNYGSSILSDLFEVDVQEKKSELLSVSEISTGNRDDQFYRYACSLRNGGSTEEEVRVFLYNLNNQIDDPLGEDQIEKCMKSAFKYKTSGEVKTLPKNTVIKNYYLKGHEVTNKSGATTTYTKEYPYIEFTDDMEEGKVVWSSFIDGSGKRFMFLKDDPTNFIQNSDEFYVHMMNNGYTLDFKSTGNITEKKYMTWIRESTHPYSRFSFLPEITKDKNTLYLTNNIEPEDNGWFRKSIDLLTLETDKDRYRFAAGILSGFLDGRFDGQKPLFSILARTKSSGKSQAVRKIIKIIQGVYNLEFDGKERDESQISGIRSLANKYVLYDNLQYIRKEQMLKITKDITDDEIPAWFMNISHARVKNNKTYFATFNDENSFNDDILNRILTIRMKDAYEITSEEKSRIATSLDLIEKNSEKVLADILYHIEKLDELKRDNYTVISPPKFPKWSHKISEILSTFFDDEIFDFGLSSDDKELSSESTMMREFLEEMMQGAIKDYKFVTNDQMVDAYREYYKQPQATKTSVSRHITNLSMNLDDYKVEKTSKNIQSKTYRGFNIIKL